MAQKWIGSFIKGSGESDGSESATRKAGFCLVRLLFKPSENTVDSKEELEIQQKLSMRKGSETFREGPWQGDMSQQVPLKWKVKQSHLQSVMTFTELKLKWLKEVSLQLMMYVEDM